MLLRGQGNRRRWYSWDEVGRGSTGGLFCAATGVTCAHAGGSNLRKVYPNLEAGAVRFAHKTAQFLRWSYPSLPGASCGRLSGVSTKKVPFGMNGTFRELQGDVFCLLLHLDPLLQRGADEAVEDGVGMVRAGEELGVELAGHEEGVILQLDDLSQLAIG